jgi:energy-coupling factor transporter transmembrane protein EcfT
MIDLNAMDVRFKMACMAVLSIAVLQSGMMALMGLSLFAMLLWGCVRLRIMEMIYPLRYLVPMLIIIFLARAGTVSFFSGDSMVSVAWDPAGAVDGGLICWRLIVLTCLGVLWMTTTRPAGIRMAVEWFCKPFPGLSGKQVATMMSLMVRFLPVLVEQARETSAAQQCRCVQNRKNPVYRTVSFSLPLLRRTFETADHLADAMESRCFSPEAIRPITWQARRSDWIALIGTAGFSAWMIFT